MKAYYYLHENGDLIYKRFEPEIDSPFVKHVWTMDTTDRADAWKIVLEALALNANISRIKELVEKWNCSPEDLVEYMIRNTSPSKLEQKGIRKYIEIFIGVDAQEWFNWLASTPDGEKPNFKSMPRGEKWKL